jgi:hypothetical protein
MNQIYHRLFSALSISLLLPLTTGLIPMAVQAAPEVMPINTPLKISLKFKAPKKGAPPATAGGATRGFCANGVKKVTPLVPKNDVGLTLAARPSFFFYAPTSPAKTAEFLLLSEDDTQVVYQRSFDLPAKAGVIEYVLPKDAPALEVGKRYHWYITLTCDVAMGPSGNPSVEGWVERTQPTSGLISALQKANKVAYPSVYADSGIWHETLASLATLRRQAPASSKAIADWRDLLKSVGLETVANEPLAN